MEDTAIFSVLNILSIYSDPVPDRILVTTTGPDILDTGIIVNQCQGLPFLFFRLECEVVGVLGTFWYNLYRVRVELGDEVDVNIKAVAFFQLKNPL